MTLKELRNKLDKLAKAYKEDTEILVYTKEKDGQVFHSPNTIMVKSSIGEDGKEVGKIYIEHK